MRRLLLEQALAKPGEAARAMPAQCYRDPAFFELETERLLRPGWHAVARWDDLPSPGDYASLELCGEPLLLVRDDRGQLRVFSRVCRHRAHPIVEGTGNARRFVCPYHRWSYDLDGSLQHAPLTEATTHFDAADCALPELRTDEWMGFVFTCLDSDAEPLSPQLSVLGERVGPLGLAEMKSAGLLEFDSPWNWKVMVDNFMESYHHMGPHARTLQKTNYAKDTYPVEIEGPATLLENPGHDGAPSFVVTQVFPTLLLAAFEEIGVATWYEMRIHSHDRFLLRVHVLAAPELAASAEAVAGICEEVRTVHLEDIQVCESVQRGIASRLWQPGPLTPYEGALASFQRYWAEQLRS